MQPSGRLVEQIEVALAALELAQLVGQLDALGLAARQQGGRVANLQIAQSQIVEYAQLVGDEPLVGEEIHPILYGHRQNLGDVLVPIGNVERVLIVARALAGGAGHFHIGHQMQLGGDRALAAALLAAASLDVEAKARGCIAALLGLGRLGEEAADVVVETNVRGWVGAGRAANGGLVDVDHIAYVLDPVEAVVRARQHAAVVEDGVELLVENVVYERALARARSPTDADEDSQGNFDVEVVEVVGAGTSNIQVAAVERAALNRHVNALATREKLAGQGV